MELEMDYYAKESYLYSISNLMTLKAFHDAGVSIDEIKVNHFMVDINYSTEPGMDILMNGIGLLFEDSEFYPWDEVHKITSKYPNVFTDGEPETCFIIKDHKIERVLESKYRKKLLRLLTRKDIDIFNHTEATIRFNEETNEIIVLIWFTGMSHELAIALTEISEMCNELLKVIEEEDNGISHKDNRSAA
ncbi:hypothetical protein [Oceanobacillus luteolus]|uniref:Uncharacterized protein n=1 Tax=Oceanobacillus luteolus TaxID=1274358 RepID=A0ABW4HY90_9BACI